MKTVTGLFMLLSLFVSTTTTARADTVLNFEGFQQPYEPILDYYNGGFGGNGSGPGPNFGIVFGADALALPNGSGSNVHNEPFGGTASMIFLSGPGDVMDVAGGFDTGFSFYYADQVGFLGSVSVYSGLDGTGSVLASLSLPTTPDPYNVFVPIGVTFAGTAQSVIFSGSANYIAFDDITLGNVTPGPSVPSPAGLTSLLSLGAIGLIFGAWRAQLFGAWRAQRLAA